MDKMIEIKNVKIKTANEPDLDILAYWLDLFFYREREEFYKKAVKNRRPKKNEKKSERIWRLQKLV